MDLEARRLRVFLAAARELHFSRAAALLHLSQPALSQQIRALERDLGVALFSRTSRRVELTAAGDALVQAAPRVLYESERAVDAARQAAQGVRGQLSIGSVRTGLASVVPEVMREFTREHPRVRFDVVQMDTALQLRALVDGSIDVGVVRAAAPTDRVDVETLVSEPLMLVLPAAHRLAEPPGAETDAAAAIDPATLRDELFVSWPRHLGADFADIVVAYCRDHGFSPSVVSEGGDIDTQLALVAAGFGVSLQPAFYSRACPAGVVFRPLSGPTPQVALQVARRRDRSDPLVAHFVETARALRDAGTLAVA